MIPQERRLRFKNTLMPSSLFDARRATLALVILLAAVLIILNAACKTQGGGANNAGGVGANDNSNVAAGEIYTTPPFQTKEPERYQAQMVLKFDSDEHPETSRTFIVRDADKRREDYEPVPGVKISDLETPAGHFLLLHDRKLYAEVTNETSAFVPGPNQSVPEDFSPDLLINESRAEARYEKLGVEELNGRSATKYRVSVLSAAGDEQSVKVEQLIWIDEHLGMPIKSETTSTGASGRPMSYTMEMIDIKEEADQSAFAVPQDYKKISMKEMLAHMAASNSLAPGDKTGEKAKGKDD
jgi:hypothetical protein